MSGGAWECMMSGIDDNSTGDGKTGKLSSGRNNTMNSGFNGIFTCTTCQDPGLNSEITEITDGIALPTDERFFEKYDYSKSGDKYNRGFLGDATKEMGPFQNGISSWYNNSASLVTDSDPWIRRSWMYSSGNGAGIFFFGGAYGHADSRSAFRIVLAF